MGVLVNIFKNYEVNAIAQSDVISSKTLPLLTI